MKNISYWLASASIPPRPPLSRDLKVDVLVVGAGITGTTSAYLLRKAGLTVALVERERVATIDTGHTTAHLTHVTDVRLSELEKNFGSDHAQAAWDAGAAAIDLIESITRDEQIDCEFTRVPGYLHVPADSHTEKERSKLQDDAALAAKLGFDAEYLEAVPHFGLPGVRFANQGEFHPRKYIAGLVAAIDRDGGHVFEGSAAGEFDGEKRRVKVNGHWIEFGRVMIATHNPLLGLSGIAGATLFQTKLALYSSYAIGARIPRGAMPLALYWDTKEPYDYWRVHRYDEDSDYVIFGGEDHKTGQVEQTNECFARLRAKFQESMPEGRVEHRWTGQVIETDDGLPFIGENAEHQFTGTGFAGNGMTFGTVTAMMAGDWATGAKNPWSELFAVDRKKIKGAAWDYLRENKD